ncbi:MAG: hypothetical protein IT293_05805 [Deltaproteobacteria bacterium]|nr:hypothetical protein [Deltaproteobacteria bacterium]
MPVEDVPVERRYYRGTVSVVHHGSRTGWLRTERGREVPFAAAHLTLVGTTSFSTLCPGLQVGFDLGRSSRGLCVTTIRVYDTP